VLFCHTSLPFKVAAHSLLCNFYTISFSVKEGKENKQRRKKNDRKKKEEHLLKGELTFVAFL
jgi:hypothetical protein